MNMNDNTTPYLTLDNRCSSPHLCPGDIIETFEGNIGVIVEAEVIINGCTYEWYEELPDHIESGWPPTYAVDFGRCGHERHAWWKASEFAHLVALSPVRKYMPLAFSLGLQQEMKNDN